jgi:tRNA (guanosine-2'-O-)-methyltransferase
MEKISLEKKLWLEFSQYLDDIRIEKMLKVVKSRTNHLRLVIQDVQNEHNISACMRSAEAFGIQHIDVVTSRSLSNHFKPSSVVRGCGDWLSINNFSSIRDCSLELKKNNYRIYVAFPDQKTKNISNLDVTKPFAVVFGNEKNGTDPAWKEYADETFTIPMDGFVESLNISVGAAISMYTLSNSCKQLLPDQEYYLNEQDQYRILYQWLRKKKPKWFI